MAGHHVVSWKVYLAVIAALCVLTGVVIASSIVFFAILLFLILTDYLSRPWPLTAVS